jgi:molybdopterin synthase catalytic subunit
MRRAARGRTDIGAVASFVGLVRDKPTTAPASRA